MDATVVLLHTSLCTSERAVRASLFFNRANMHLALALCMYFVMTFPSPFSSQLLDEICSNKIALAAWIRLNRIPNGNYIKNIKVNPLFVKCNSSETDGPICKVCCQ